MKIRHDSKQAMAVSEIKQTRIRLGTIFIRSQREGGDSEDLAEWLSLCKLSVPNGERMSAIDQQAILRLLKSGEMSIDAIAIDTGRSKYATRSMLRQLRKKNLVIEPRKGTWELNTKASASGASIGTDSQMDG
jgi:hypothetical protein